MRDPLIEALIGKVPSDGPWPVEAREAWLTLMRAAFEFVYGDGNVAAARTPAAVRSDYAARLETLPAELRAAYRDPPADVLEIPDMKLRAGRWYIEPDGTARTPTGAEANLESVPHGTALIDYRRDPEYAGRIDTVIWADGTWPAGHVGRRELKLEAAEAVAA